MCGINAIFAYGTSAPPVDRAELMRTREHMVARGPDGAGIWMSPDGKIGLAHRRLAIIDLSETGAQPMATSDGQSVISFNGEIYNYRSLRHELEAKGYRFRGQSDTEVLLHLYADRGVEMVQALRGMYAFVIWDEAKKGVFLARDPFGIKPLYYADDGGTVRVASQVKALIAGGAIETPPDPAGHVGFFLWGHVPEPYTLFKSIRALPAGSTLWIGTDGKKLMGQFFDISKELAEARERSVPQSRPEVQDLVYHALIDSVRHHMIADVPVGVFLSAGLDSSTIVSLANDTGCTSLRTITLGFKEFQGKRGDEVPFAEMVAGQYRTLHQTRWIDKRDFAMDRDRILQSMDQPSIDGVNSYLVSKVAAASGLKVALSGLGGDELFAGYPSFRRIPNIASVFRAFQRMPSVGKAARILSAPFLRQLTSPKYASLFEYGGTFEGAYLLHRGMHLPWELPRVLDSELIREGLEELRTLHRLQSTHQGIDGAHGKITALESAWYMRNQLLRDTDWASMAHSIEVRTPMVDVDLLRAVAPLIVHERLPSKRDVAKSLPSPLPHEITKRKKTGFTVPVEEWSRPDTTHVAARRGLRGWSNFVYRHFADGRYLVNTPVAVIFRTGQLGDTLVALPALERIRIRYPYHHLVLLTDRQQNVSGYVSSWDICSPTGWFQQVVFYEPRASGWIALRQWTKLLLQLRSLKADDFFNLAPSRTTWQAIRDRFFFLVMAGIRRYHAPTARYRNPPQTGSGQLPTVQPEWQRIVSCVDSAPMGNDAFRLRIAAHHREAAARVALAERIDPKARVLAIGPGSKMPAKVWSSSRFAELGVRLRQEHSDLHLAVLGGKEDAAVGRELCKVWGTDAHCLAGQLSIYESAAFLERCEAYVGNDTGTMHLAAVVGIPCIAIFSARDYPGRWNPYGDGHIVLRREVGCAGCMLEICEREDNKCLKLISVEEVFQGVSTVLRRTRPANARQSIALPS